MRASPGDTLKVRLFRRVALPDHPDACWPWLGALSAGYGSLRVYGRHFHAHRLAYVIFNGPIPPGLVIDHVCRNPACVNPTHLEAVPHRENVLRGTAGDWQRRKTHCPQGHEYTPENMYSRPKGHGRERQCVTCKVAQRG